MMPAALAVAEPGRYVQAIATVVVEGIVKALGF